MAIGAPCGSNKDALGWEYSLTYDKCCNTLHAIGMSCIDAINIDFRKNLVFWPNKGGGGLTEAQVFVEIFQNQICLGKWLEM